MLVDLNESEVIEVDHIDKDNYEEYIGKTIKVTGDVNLRNLGLTKIPINFTEVDGNFYCHENKLSSLEGAPEKVGRDFDCYENKLTSLVGAPKEVGKNFVCWDNPLKSFEDKPEYIGGKFLKKLM